MERRHFQPDEVVDDFEDIWSPPASFFAREHHIADGHAVSAKKKAGQGSLPRVANENIDRTEVMN